MNILVKYKNCYISKIKIFAKQINEANNIFVFGEPRELPLFYDFQELLGLYHMN